MIDNVLVEKVCLSVKESFLVQADLDLNRPSRSDGCLLAARQRFSSTPRPAPLPLLAAFPESFLTFAIVVPKHPPQPDEVATET